MALNILNRIRNFQNIVWDWNGTLINDSDIAAAAERELFIKYGLKEQTPEERKKNFCFPIEKYYEKMGFDFSKVSYEELSHQWLANYEELLKSTPLFSGAYEMIRELHREGKRQFVLSAAPEDHVRTMVVRHSIFEFFEAVYGLPHRRADSKVQRGLELVADYKINVKDCILVGDTPHDLEVAKAMGCECLLVGDGHSPVEALDEIHNNVLKTRF